VKDKGQVIASPFAPCHSERFVPQHKLREEAEGAQGKLQRGNPRRDCFGTGVPRNDKRVIRLLSF